MAARLFQFHFAGSTEVELIETRFVSAPFEAPRVAVRGKTAGAVRDAGTFQWTTGVRALCVLFLKGSLAKISSLDDSLLSGMHGSLAASLDYAMSKQPSWLVDMFGTDSQGKCMASRLINRTNTERKRPGPVTLGLKPVVLYDADIEIYLENKRISSLTDLREMLARLGGTDLFTTDGEALGALAA